MNALLLEIFDDILSRGSSDSRVDQALHDLQSIIFRLGLSSAKAELRSFRRLQDNFEYNVVLRLFHFLEMRSVSLLEGESLAATRTTSQFTQVLSTMQGIFLLHLPSQKMLARRSHIECLLSLLSFKPDGDLDNSDLQCQVLDALLCGLVDQPGNIRAFERMGGLKIVIGILKAKKNARQEYSPIGGGRDQGQSKKHAGVVRLKALEFLYFYLLPECGDHGVDRASPSCGIEPPRRTSPMSQSQSMSQESSLDCTFTTVASSVRYQPLSDPDLTGPPIATGTDDPTCLSESAHDPRVSRKGLSERLQNAVGEWVPSTPVKAGRKEALGKSGSLHRIASMRNASLSSSPLTPSKTNVDDPFASPITDRKSSRLGKQTSSFERTCTGNESPRREEVGTKSVEEKKALLTRYLGNAEALFKRLDALQVAF